MMTVVLLFKTIVLLLFFIPILAVAIYCYLVGPVLAILPKRRREDAKLVFEPMITPKRKRHPPAVWSY